MENNDEGLWAFKWKEEENSDGREHLLFSAQLPREDNLRCKIHLGDLPDPNNIIYVLNRVYLKYCDPGLLQKGVIREQLEAARKLSIKWRNDGVKSFAERLKLDPSIFPPVPEQASTPKFAPFGPKESLIDGILIDIADALPWSLFLSISMFILFSIVYLTPLFPVPFEWKAASIFQILVMLVGFCFFARYMIWQGHLAMFRSKVSIFIAYGRLKQLLKDLVEHRTSLNNQGMEIVAATTKSRTHPDKKAYSVSVIAPMKMKIKKTEVKVTLHIHIIAETINQSPIIFYWYDTCGNPFRIRETWDMIEKIQSQFWRLRVDIEEDSKLVWDKRHYPGEYEEWYQSYIVPRTEMLREHGLIINENLAN